MLNITRDAGYVCVLLGAAELPNTSGSTPAKKRRVDASTSKAGNTVRHTLPELYIGARWIVCRY